MQFYLYIFCQGGDFVLPEGVILFCQGGDFALVPMPMLCDIEPLLGAFCRMLDVLIMYYGN